MRKSRIVAVAAGLLLALIGHARAGLFLNQFPVAATNSAGDIVAVWQGTAPLVQERLDTLAGFLDGLADPLTNKTIDCSLNTCLNVPPAALNGGTGASSSTYWRGDGTWASPAGAGSVASVGLSMPARFTVGSTPITGAGVLGVTDNNQSANQFFAGPTTGSAATPGFRAIATADLPPSGSGSGSCTNCNISFNAAGQITAGSTGTGPTGPAWTILNATNTSADDTNLTNALGSGAQIIYFNAGTYDICAQHNVPAYVTLVGPWVNSYPANGVPSRTQALTVFRCTTTSSFSSLQAPLALEDGDVVKGIAFYDYSAVGNVNGINILNCNSCTILYSTFVDNYYGIYSFSNGGVAGLGGQRSLYSNSTRLSHNYFQNNTQWGYWEGSTAGGFISDLHFGPQDEMATQGLGGFHFAPGFPTLEIFGERIEDIPGACIDLTGVTGAQVIGNQLDRCNPAVNIAGSSIVGITGNIGGCCITGTGSAVNFSGANTKINLAGNAWRIISGATGIYKATGSFTGIILENPAYGASSFPADYFDSNSKTVLAAAAPYVN